MFEKIGQVAEKVATGVSRRQFLGRLGITAALASAVGALLAQPALAGRRGNVCDASSASRPTSVVSCTGRLCGR